MFAGKGALRILADAKGRLSHSARVAVLPGLFLLAGCAAAPARDGAAVRDCYAPISDFSNADRIAAACRKAAGDDSATVGQVETAHMNLGRAEARLGHADAAAEAFEYVLLLDTSRDDARYELARIRAASGRYQEALRLLDRVIATDAANVPALLIRAETYIARGRVRDRLRALDDLQAVVRLGARDSGAPGQAEQARAMIRDIALELGESLLAQRPMSEDATLQAIEALSAARGVSPDDGDILRSCAKAGLRMATHFGGNEGSPDYSCTGEPSGSWNEAALAAYRKLARLEPADPEPRAGAARALANLGRMSAAVEAWREASRRAPEDVSHLVSLAQTQVRWARQLEESAQLSAAAQLLRDAVNSYRQAIEARGGGGLTHFEMAEAHLSLAALERRAGNGPSAGEHRQAALDALQQARRNGYRKAALWLGRFHYDDGPAGFDEARRHFEDVLASGAAADLRAEAHYYLSLVAADDRSGGQDWGQARNHITRAIALDGNNDTYRLQACLVDIGRGRVGSSSRFECTSGSRAGAGALLIEGMHHLREAHFAREDNKKRAWEAAYRAFSEGLDSLRRRGERADPELRARLEVGRGIAHYCVGFASIGEETIDATGRLRDQARVFFDTYHVAQCIDY
jgi:tetratricopeptide (TPR) repeat protein